MIRPVPRFLAFIPRVCLEIGNGLRREAAQPLGNRRPNPGTPAGVSELHVDSPMVTLVSLANHQLISLYSVGVALVILLTMVSGCGYRLANKYPVCADGCTIVVV